MRNILFIGILLIALVCISCRDRSYQGVDPIIPDEEIQLEQVPIVLTAGDPSYSILTRGGGAFDTLANDDEHQIRLRNAATFYIYAFPKENPNFKIRLSEASESETGANPHKDNCLVDGSLDMDGNDGGKPAVFNQTGYNFLSWKNDNAYYNTVHQTRPYNFYAYYVDSLFIKNKDHEITRTKDKISFNVEIDGRMDIMSAMAEITEKQNDTIISKLPEKEQALVKEYKYSAYTAHRGIMPDFVFRHHMAKLNFELYPGDSLYKYISLDTIQLYANTIGEFTVVAKDPQEIGVKWQTSPKWLLLKEKDGTKLKQYKINWTTGDDEKTDIYQRTKTEVGGSLLIPPCDSVNIEIKFQQEVGKEEVRRFVTAQPLILKKDGERIPLSEGHAYTIRIAVFGDRKIDISTTISAWAPGGDIDVNPDENYEF